LAVSEGLERMEATARPTVERVVHEKGWVPES
jgi:hypothetical protein